MAPARFDEVSAIVLTGLLAITPLALANGLFLSHDVMPKVVLILVGAALVLFLLPQWEPVIPLVWQQPRGRIFYVLRALRRFRCCCLRSFHAAFALTGGNDVAALRSC